MTVSLQTRHAEDRWRKQIVNPVPSDTAFELAILCVNALAIYIAPVKAAASSLAYNEKEYGLG